MLNVYNTNVSNNNNTNVSSNTNVSNNTIVSNNTFDITYDGKIRDKINYIRVILSKEIW